MDLDEAIAAKLFVRSEDDMHAAAVAREHILTNFPLSAWPQMPLERYAQGTAVSKSSFCYALEVASRILGSISGGNAAKFGVFQHHSGEWRIPKDYSSEAEAWEAIRTGFCNLFDLAQAGEWGEAANVPIPVWAMVALKVLHVYFPDEVLPIFARSWLEHYAKLLGIDPKLPPLTVNRAINAALRSRPELSGCTALELATLLWTWDTPSGTGRRANGGSSVYMKVAPGEGASQWEDCLRDGYICAGWDAVGDLSLFESVDEVAQAMAQAYPGDSEGSHKWVARNLWLFRNLQPGNHVVANKGTTEVLGIGTVREEGYLHLPEREDHKHTVAVDWDTSFARKFDPPFGGWRSTFQMLKLADVARIKGAAASAPHSAVAATSLPDYSDSEHIAFTQWSKALTRKKQIIFYGPPGTGKTYQAKRFAEWYLQRNAAPQPDALTHITFHSSYTYEEFIEGYRPLAGEGEGLHLARMDGVFKKVCAAAAQAPEREFFLLIDELNRANAPRVFGELLTVIEADKRGSSVMLPASQELFAVPENLLILGTMNTADRSIRTLDAALRRRFAFVELMPDPGVLESQTSGGAIPLALDLFLDELNHRITERAGRERQIGHAFFLDHGNPVTDLTDFAQIIRLEIIPLLQELAYDDYTQLAHYLGSDLVDANAQRLVEVDDETLVELLAAEYRASATQL